MMIAHMALRTAHGAARGRGPRVEVLPPDELPAPVPMQRPVVARRPRGRPLRSGDAVSLAIQSAGGHAKAGKVSLAASLGLGAAVAGGEAFKAYARKAASFRRAYCAQLAALGGGVCGAGPSSMVATAALQLATSRYLYDLATRGEPDAAMMKEARQQGDSSRQNLLAAYELAVREGQARSKSGAPLEDVEAMIRRAEERDIARRADEAAMRAARTVEAASPVEQ